MKNVALTHSSPSALTTAVVDGHGPSSKVRTTSLSRRKSCWRKCSKPKPGPGRASQPVPWQQEPVVPAPERPAAAPSWSLIVELKPVPGPAKTPKQPKQTLPHNASKTSRIQEWNQPRWSRLLKMKPPPPRVNDIAQLSPRDRH